MKKLIVGMFALCAAVAAQAAYVDWQYSVSDKKTGGTGVDYTSGYTAYLITSSAWDGIKDSFDQTTLASKSLDSSAFYTATGTKTQNKYSTGTSASALGIRQVTGETGNYYIILASADGYNVAVNNASITAYTDELSAGTGLTPGVTISPGSAVDVAGLSFTAYPSGGGDVPEPTSGLLLLVGGAMLALRRKQK